MKQGGVVRVSMLFGKQGRCNASANLSSSETQSDRRQKSDRRKRTKS